jgi:heme exporter protein C
VAGRLSRFAAREAEGERRALRVARALGIAAVVWMGALLVMALLVAPPDALQGQSQRLMYLHVPAAWTAFAAFGVVAVCSVALLLGGRERMWAVSGAAAELGVAMTGLTLAEGSIWGHAAWGVWWAWDPRLVSTAVLFLVYVAYLAGRSLAGTSWSRRLRVAAVGACSALLVPVVHFSVLWWRTLHQPPTHLAPSLHPPIDPLMLTALLVGVVSFSLAGSWYVVRRSVALLLDASPEHVEPAPPRLVLAPPAQPPRHAERRP